MQPSTTVMYQLKMWHSWLQPPYILLGCLSSLLQQRCKEEKKKWFPHNLVYGDVATHCHVGLFCGAIFYMHFWSEWTMVVVHMYVHMRTCYFSQMIVDRQWHWSTGKVQLYNQAFCACVHINTFLLHCIWADDGLALYWQCWIMLNS